MFLNTVLVPYYSGAKGSNIDLLDPHAVQQNFNNIQSESATNESRWQAAQTDMSNRIAKLETDYKTLDHFMKFCAEQRPEAIQAYMAMLRAQDRLGVGSK
jgi:hypothetical protein